MRPEDTELASGEAEKDKEPHIFPIEFGDPGMSLRDYFAAKVIQGFAANPAVFASNSKRGWGLVNCTNDELCGFAYRLANAMLNARVAVEKRINRRR